MKSSAKQWYVVTAVLAVAVVAALLSRSDVSAPGTSGTPTPSASVSKTPAPGGGSSTPTPTPTLTPVASTYSEAVQQYQGRRIEFGLYCNATPSSATFKTGTSIMLDNRSGDARYVAVGGTSHYLTGYGWKIITLFSDNPPTTLYLDCGSSVNVGTILLQK